MFNNLNSNIKKIYFIGIGGISMSALAKFAIEENYLVEGSDEKSSSLTKELENRGAKIFYEHSPQNIKEDVSLVVYSPAIGEDNPELKRARKLGIKIMNRKNFLALVANSFDFNIAISGSHGKTTTTAMLAHVFNCLDVPTTAHVGGECFDIGGNLLYSKERMLFITEACEYVDSFLALSPHYSAILNIQSDHMDYFKTEENLISSFVEFANNTSDFVFVNFDDQNCLRACEKIYKDKIVGLSVENEERDLDVEPQFVARNLLTNTDGCVEFECFCGEKRLGRFELSIFGYHNVYNAMMVVAIAYYYGLDMEKVSKAIKSFSGIKRRYEKIGFVNGAKVVHDYAHHPEEITKVIEETSLVCKGRLIVVFQPHTYSRTRDLLDEFIQSLSLADEVVMYPIYPAREKPIEGITSYALTYLLREKGVKASHFYTFEELANYLSVSASKEDVVLILGAGDIVELCEVIKGLAK